MDQNRQPREINCTIYNPSIPITVQMYTYSLRIGTVTKIDHRTLRMMVICKYILHVYCIGDVYT